MDYRYRAGLFRDSTAGGRSRFLSQFAAFHGGFCFCLSIVMDLRDPSFGTGGTPVPYSPSPEQDLEVAGRGGMAEVYKATHPTLKRVVAIKLMREAIQDDPVMRLFFERESRALREHDHPNVIKVLDTGKVEDCPYMVMEFIQGSALGDLLKDGRLDLERTLQLLKPISAALDYLHAHNIVHRDVKPGNIMLDQAGREVRPIITDFGLAKVLGDPSLISQSAVAGTFAYIAPEQIEARRDIDGRADVYALGVMTYQLLTGELPFKHEHQGALLIAHMLHASPDARERAPDLPEGAAKRQCPRNHPSGLERQVSL